MDEIIKIIEKYGLIANTRKAVLYNASLGDYYALCRSVKYAEKALNKQYVLFYNSENQEVISNWFKHDIKAIKITRSEWMAIRYLPNNTPYSEYFELMNRYSDFQKITRNKDAASYAKELSTPVFDRFDPDRYSEYILPGKTVLIIPSANTVQSFPKWFWDFSAKLFMLCGYNVVFNAKPEEGYNGASLLIPLNDVVGFADACGYVFGMRTGLFDILSASAAKMIIFSTKGYAPIDEVFHINNEDKRIQTVILPDKDIFYEKFDLLNIVFSELNKERSYYNSLISNYEQLLDETDQSNTLNSPDISAVEYVKDSNKTYLKSSKSKPIRPFVNIQYSIYIDTHEQIVLKLSELNFDKYRVSLTLYRNGEIYLSFSDFKSNRISIKPTGSGEYYYEVVITDSETCNQEYFESSRIIYYSNEMLKSVTNISDINSLELYLAYLYKERDNLIIFISSKDAHTRPKSAEFTCALRLFKGLGYTFDFENTYRHSYLSICDSGNIVVEHHSADEIISYEYKFGDHTVNMTSAGFNATQNNKTPIDITIDDVDCSVNHRGLNFVIWDKKTDALIDSVCFDSFDRNKCYRKGEKNDI